MNWSHPPNWLDFVFGISLYSVQFVSIYQGVDDCCVCASKYCGTLESRRHMHDKSSCRATSDFKLLQESGERGGADASWFLQRGLLLYMSTNHTYIRIPIDNNDLRHGKLHQSCSINWVNGCRGCTEIKAWLHEPHKLLNVNYGSGWLPHKLKHGKPARAHVSYLGSCT